MIFHNFTVFFDYKIDFKSIIRQAFETWDNCSGITFKEVDGYIIRIGSFAFHSAAIAEAFSPPYQFQESLQFPGDIYFNTKYTLLIPRRLIKNKNKKIEKRFYMASLHEIGHAIGLEHNEQEESVMTTNHNSLFYMDDLSHNDIDHITLLYGFSELNAAECLPLKRYIEGCFLEGEIINNPRCLPLKVKAEQSEGIERVIREFNRPDLLR